VRSATALTLHLRISAADLKAGSDLSEASPFAAAGGQIRSTGAAQAGTVAGMIERQAKAGRWALAVARGAAVAAICLAGCAAEEPFLASGTIDGAEVRFGSNRALADNIARRHCGQYERDARFIGYGADTAFYECDRR